jgi:hypothetical protein
MQKFLRRVFSPNILAQSILAIPANRIRDDERATYLGLIASGFYVYADCNSTSNVWEVHCIDTVIPLPLLTERWDIETAYRRDAKSLEPDSIGWIVTVSLQHQDTQVLHVRVAIDAFSDIFPEIYEARAKRKIVSHINRCSIDGTHPSKLHNTMLH